MFNSIKEKVTTTKFKVGAVVAAGSPAVLSTTALASTSNDTAQNLSTGIAGFMDIVTTMLNAVLGSPVLAIAFAASFAMVALKMVKRLKK